MRDGGRNTIDKMKPFYEEQGFFVKEVDYGWMGLLGVRFCNMHLAHILARLLDPDCYLVGHSNGCAISALACDFGYRPAGLVFLQPALNRNWVPPAQVPWLKIYRNTDDLPVWLATWLRNHIWGQMGRLGPSYKDDRVETVDIGFGGHNAEFKSPAIMQWIAEDLKQRYLKDEEKQRQLNRERYRT